MWTIFWAYTNFGHSSRKDKYFLGSVLINGQNFPYKVSVERAILRVNRGKGSG